jgi:hypothetical protein
MTSFAGQNTISREFVTRASIGSERNFIFKERFSVRNLPPIAIN